jgi:hypothetical protein
MRKTDPVDPRTNHERILSAISKVKVYAAMQRRNTLNRPRITNREHYDIRAG